MTEWWEDYDNDPDYFDGEREPVEGEVGYIAPEDNEISIEDVLGIPKPVSKYMEGITPVRCDTLGCGVFVYESIGMWYEYNTGIAHTCIGRETKPKPPIAKERTMNNNVKVISRPTKGISASTLNVGEYARIVTIASSTDSVGDIVLKTVSNVVNISRPSAYYQSFNTPLVERLNTGDKLEITVGFTAEFEERIRREAQSNKIMAIKSVREVTFWGLKESKDYVDSLLLKF